MTVLAHDPGCKAPRKIPPYVKAKHATFSGPGDCYRTKLVYQWDENLPMMLLVMMNPSAASLDCGDATVNKGCEIAKWNGFGGLYVGNACSYRCTQSKRLLEVEDPVGPDNHDDILEMAANSGRVVIATGRLPGKLQIHADEIVNLLLGRGFDLYVLRLLSDGTPSHTLARGRGHIPVKTVPTLWRRASGKHI